MPSIRAETLVGRALRETDGPTDLLLGIILDGEVLKRVGTNVVGVTVNDVVSNTVTTSDATVTTLATIAIPDDTAVLIDASIISRRTDAADRGGYLRRALVFREAAGSATLQGNIDTPFTRESSGPWNVTIDVNGDDARIRVTGQAGKTIHWRSEHSLNQES